jgi:hypothetical protein
MFEIRGLCSRGGGGLRAALNQGAAGDRVGRNQQQEQQTGGGRKSRVTCGQKVTASVSALVSLHDALMLAIRGTCIGEAACNTLAKQLSAFHEFSVIASVRGKVRFWERPAAFST